MNTEVESSTVKSLTKNDIHWLKTAWSILRDTSNYPEYMELRIKTLPHTGPKYLPLKINRELITDEATRITLDGLIAIGMEKDVLSALDKFANCTRALIMEKGKVTELDVSQIASKIAVDESLLRLSLELGDKLGRFSDRKSKNDSKVGWQTLGINRPETIDFYVQFESIEQLLASYHNKKSDSIETLRQIESYSELSTDDFQDIALHTNLALTALGTNLYVNEFRLNELKAITNQRFDMQKLIQLCTELNSSFQNKNYYAVAFLVRAIIDHVPPVFNAENFKMVSSEYKSDGNVKSFREAMRNLDSFSRKICDGHLHSLIRKKEVLPNETQVDFKASLDQLLGEIVRILR
ncbi:MAG: hypothetical protein R2813_05255 [Flavobacteriales bacterium]